SVMDQTHGRPDCTSLRIGGGVPREPRALARVLHGGASVSRRTVRRDLRRPHGLAALAEGESGAASGLARSTFARRRTACAALCAAWRDTPSRSAAIPDETPSTRMA